MKRLCLITFCLFIALQTFAQVSIDVTAFETAIKAKANTLCEYIVAVGTSTGQSGSVSDIKKNNIIRNDVPRLFYNYEDRYMKTTGSYGKVYSKKMSIYFNNLKAQSRGDLNKKIIYELSYDGIITQNTSNGLKYEGIDSHGCKIYSTTIRIKQRYYQINLSAYGIEGKSIEKIEDDIKDYKVYIVIKPDGKAGVFLGDVYRAKRV